MRPSVAVAGVVAGVAGAGLMWHSCAARALPTSTRESSLPANDRARQINTRALGRASIAGTVRSEDHVPIVGARVCADYASADLPRLLMRDTYCTVSDDRGAYVIDSLRATSYRIGASARTYRPALALSVDDGELKLRDGEHRTGVDIELRNGGAEITGTVSDVSGGLVPHATITTDQEYSPSGAMVEADDSGHFSVWVAPGEVGVSAAADGYADRYQHVAAPGTIAISLVPEASLAGTVVDATTGEPLAGIAVEASRFEWMRWIDPGAGVTDERGRFRIDRLSPARYAVLAHSDHGTGLSEGSIIVGAGQRVDDIIVKLHPAVEIAGKIQIDDKPPRACPEPSLSLTTIGTDVTLYGRGAPDGTAHVGGVLPGMYEVHPSCTGFVSPKNVKIEVKDRDLTGLTWLVQPGATIRGHVLTRAGEPVDGAHVEGYEAGWTTSGRDGSYKLEAVAGGKHTLHVESDRGFAPTQGWDISIGERGVVDQDLVLEDGGSIHGNVVDTTGAPVPGFYVHARRIEADGRAPEVRGARTTTDGTFTISPLRTGEYRVAATPTRDDDPTDGQPVVVHAPQVTAVRLSIEIPAGAIHGTVRDAAGLPVTDAYVVAVREADTRSPLEDSRWMFEEDRIMTSTSGGFTIPKLAAGRYTVRAFRKGGGEAIAEHVALETTLQLQIKPTGTIEGTVRASEDELSVEVRDLKTGLRRSDRFLRTGGHYVLRDLPAGRYVLQASTAHASTGTTIDLAEGQHATVDLAFDGGVTVTGRIVDVIARRPVDALGIRALVGNVQVTRPSTTDGSGRFRLDHVPPGAIVVSGDDGRFWLSRMVRIGAVDVELGDIGVAHSRVDDGKRAGNLGVQWLEYSDDTLSDQRAFQVQSIDPVGPAAASGLQVGDIVTKIDGASVIGANRAAGWSLLDTPPGTAVHLGVARGPTITVVLAAPP